MGTRHARLNKRRLRNAESWDSDLPVERYHALSDATMDTLWESLEELLDAEGNPNYEVEYSVRRDFCPWVRVLTILPPEWGAHAQAG